MIMKNFWHLLPGSSTKAVTSICIPSGSVLDCLFNLILIESCGFAQITQEQISFAFSVDNNWSILVATGFYNRVSGFLTFIYRSWLLCISNLSWGTEVSLASLLLTMTCAVLFQRFSVLIILNVHVTFSIW